MSEGTAGMPDDYGKLIEEVFIDPIRTCVVVDDEFPTLDALLDKEMGKSDGDWKPEHVRQARKIIDFCRAPERGWLVDIHDGPKYPSNTEEITTAAHLHQSDLMVLDYHLDKSRPEDNSDAIRILRAMAGNDHFNLVIVYTKGYGAAGGDISRVVREIAVALSSFDSRLTMLEKPLDVVQKVLEEWEDSDAKIAERILEAIDDGVYLKARTEPPGNIDWKKVGKWIELQAIQDLVNAAPATIHKKVGLIQLAQWALHRRQQKLENKLSSSEYGVVNMSDGFPVGANWIRTDRLFVTVVSKTEEPALIPEKLLDALHDWRPEPHRLLMSKMRAELGERGVLAEAEVLGNRHLQAGWFEEFLTQDDDERRWKIHNTINRHWEGMGGAIRPAVTGYAERLACHLIDSGRDKVLEELNKSLDLDEIRSNLNRYSSCKPAVEGGYLTTGHVLRLNECKGDECYWLCLSPACDLVPGQKGKSGWHKRLGGHTPFIAVRLFEAKKIDALSNATGGSHLFLQIDKAMRYFSFTPNHKVNGNEVDRTANPMWEQMFAARLGRFDSSNKELMISRVVGKGGMPIFDICHARVIAQLRYEYALNLLQRLGASLTRVGLDFVGMPAVAPGDGQADN